LVRVIADASTLIVLARIGELDTVYAIYGPIGITETVYEEVVIEGKKRSKDDALVVEAAIERGILTKVSLSSEERRLADVLHASSPAYGLGECEAIAVAEVRKKLLLIEERKAKVLAKVRGVRYTIAQMIPLEGYIKGKIPYEKCQRMLEKVASAMHTDLAVLNGLKKAVEAIERERRKGK